MPTACTRELVVNPVQFDETPAAIRRAPPVRRAHRRAVARARRRRRAHARAQGLRRGHVVDDSGKYGAVRDDARRARPVPRRHRRRDARQPAQGRRTVRGPGRLRLRRRELLRDHRARPRCPAPICDGIPGCRSRPAATPRSRRSSSSSKASPRSSPIPIDAVSRRILFRKSEEMFARLAVDREQFFARVDLGRPGRVPHPRQPAHDVRRDEAPEGWEAFCGHPLAHRYDAGRRPLVAGEHPA